MDDFTIHWWVKDDGPTSIRHRLHMAAIGASPNGTVTLGAGLVSDIADALDGAARLARSSEALAKASRANLRLQKLTDTEQFAWRMVYLGFGFALGARLDQWALVAWRVLHAG